MSDRQLLFVVSFGDRKSRTGIAGFQNAKLAQGADGTIASHDLSKAASPVAGHRGSSAHPTFDAHTEGNVRTMSDVFRLPAATQRSYLS